MKKLFILLFVGLASTVSFPTFATEELANVENISKIASLVRWSGVFFSMIVIAAMWLLLKFINSLVTSFGSQFVQYRMLLQKLQSFTQFFIYVSTGLIVFMMSFRINSTLTTMIRLTPCSLKESIAAHAVAPVAMMGSTTMARSAGPPSCCDVGLWYGRLL